MSATEALHAPTNLRGVVVAGLAVIVIGFGGFLTWSFNASLDSAAVARGVVRVHSQRKTIQHLEGGILKALHVKDGDRVEKGQLLIEIDATASKSTLDRVRMDNWAAHARVERLHAERQERRELAFSDVLLRQAAINRKVAEILETERNILISRWNTHEGRIALNGARIAQLKEEIRALEAQAEARRQQLAINREELERLVELIARGFESKRREFVLRLEVAELSGERAELLARAAQSRQAIKEAELSSISLNNERVTEIYSQLKEAQRLAAELDETRRAAEDVVRRTKVVAPQTGLVTDLRVYTIGGVIAPGQPILDLVPLGDELIVEAMVQPKDIDSVRVGLETQVRLTAYRQRVTPTVDGKVVHVSADMLTDERTGAPYFLARVKLDPESLEGIERIELYPGMPADVLIVTGRRKAIDYFIGPIADGMARALREE